MTYHFNRNYFIIFFLLLITEIGIALFINDNWIRPFFGDFLVVILLYCLLRSLIIIKTHIALIGVLLFAYLVEMLQYFNFVRLIGLADYAIARTLIGTHFSWIDMLMYTAGILFTAAIEMFFMKKWPYLR